MSKNAPLMLFIFRLSFKPLRFIHAGLLFLLVAFLPHQMQGQCGDELILIYHTSGTQQVGCTNVTVTSDGAAGTLTYCVETPYWIGIGTASGSYTFTFSPPVSSVSLGLTAINNQPAIPSQEEVRFEIDGVPYPITVPGTPGSCFTPAIITGTGAVGAVAGEVGEWGIMTINETITTLKVEDVIFAGTPNGVIFSLYINCTCCVTDAGTMQDQTIQACVNEPAVLNHNGDEMLDSDDLLQFILFSNTNDTLGSILAVNNTPVFTFNPATMETEIPYYVAAIAGNNLGGNVDLNDSCLNVSNASIAIWHPLPEVVLVADNGDLCTGECGTISATFAGTPPFTLTYTTPGGGSATQTFPENTGTFEVCVPPNAPAGPVTIQATALSDTFCTCN